MRERRPRWDLQDQPVIHLHTGDIGLRQQRSSVLLVVARLRMRAPAVTAQSQGRRQAQQQCGLAPLVTEM